MKHRHLYLSELHQCVRERGDLLETRVPNLFENDPDGAYLDAPTAFMGFPGCPDLKEIFLWCLQRLELEERRAHD